MQVEFRSWWYCTREEQIERWVQCLRVLEGLDEHARAHHWHMGCWGRKTACGTIACAAGHCALDPWFQERGFHFSWYPLDAKAQRYYPSVLEQGVLNGVTHFFGPGGSDRIFHNITPRPVETVISEVRAYIARLRSCADGQHPL